ncbi:MAG: response regulator [Bacteroidia bacterium]
MPPEIEKYKKTVAIVDDHVLFRQGFSGLLKELTPHEIIFEAGDGKELLDKLQARQPDLIFLDIEMPVIGGIDATILVKQKYPDVKIIIISMHSEEELIHYLLEKGANGFLSKSTDIEIVINAINKVCEFGYYLDYNILTPKDMANMEEIKKQIFFKADLSDREIEVVRLMCKQHTTREIAEILSISQRTIDTYREKIFNKTKSRNVAGVVFYALKHNLLY